MKRFGKILLRVFVVCYLIAVHSLAFLYLFERFVKPSLTLGKIDSSKVGDPTEPEVLPSIVPVHDTPEAEASPAATVSAEQIPSGADNAQRLMIPVVGVRRESLQDNFTDARSEDRSHNAIDISAPPGTPVVAASDGEIVRFFDSERGGITIYQYSPDRRFVFYYAHLQKRAENIKEGDFVRQGTVIGYVGDSGNAAPGNYHLHFAISRLEDPKRYFEGEALNPYLLLKEGIEPR